MTKPTKTNRPPIKVAGLKVFEAPGVRHPPGCAATGTAADPSHRKTAPKPEIADQIGLQLRSVYDDILAQPVPGRFLDLLRQLEGSPEARSSKDAM